MRRGFQFWTVAPPDEALVDEALVTTVMRWLKTLFVESKM